MMVNHRFLSNMPDNQKSFAWRNAPWRKSESLRTPVLAWSSLSSSGSSSSSLASRRAELVNRSTPVVVTRLGTIITSKYRYQLNSPQLKYIKARGLNSVRNFLTNLTHNNISYFLFFILKTVLLILSDHLFIRGWRKNQRIARREEIVIFTI